MGNLLWFWIILVSLILGAAGYSLAKKKYRNGWLWFFNCIFLGLLGLLVLACSSSFDPDDDYFDEETDMLGWWMFVIGILWFGLGVYYGMELVEEYNRQRAWYNVNSFLGW